MRVKALKKDKFLSELPEEQVVAADLEITDSPIHLDSNSTSFICEVFIQSPTDLK